MRRAARGGPPQGLNIRNFVFLVGAEIKISLFSINIMAKKHLKITKYIKKVSEILEISCFLVGVEFFLVPSPGAR